MLSPVTLEKVKTFLLRGGHRTFSSNPKTEIICVAIISWEICLSYLGKYLEIWMLYLFTQPGQAVDPKQI